ncbi:MAG TPA: GNAT family N-acetyltransferase [Dongiaceae bacterium]
MSDALAAARIEILPAQSADEIAAVSTLFQEYAASLDVSLCFQGFDKELAEMPGAYAPPLGRLFLVHVDGRPAGCIALRPLDEDRNRCEMKRLYLRPGNRGLGLGRRLAELVIAEARSIGYRKLVLDTLADMKEARALYAGLGFREIPAYYDNPLPGVLYAELDLGR